MILSITAYLPSVYSPGASFQSNFGTTVGLSWGTQGPKDLTETDSTISRPWTSPNPDNPLTAGNGRQRNRSLFLQFSQREVKQMSITHSLSTQQDSWLYLEDEQVRMERRWRSGIQSQVKWAPFGSIGVESLHSDV